MREETKGVVINDKVPGEEHEFIRITRIKAIPIAIGTLALDTHHSSLITHRRGLRIFGGSVIIRYDGNHGMGQEFMGTLLPVRPFMERFLDHNAFNLRLIDQLCAFNLYTRHGFDTACSVYPEQREFILAHKHQTLEEVRRECYKDLEKNSDRY